MSYYNLSRDYDKLYDLLLAGHTLAGFVTSPNSNLRDVVKIGKGWLGSYYIAVRGIQYGGVAKDDRFGFMDECERLSLEWIEHNEFPKGAGVL